MPRFPARPQEKSGAGGFGRAILERTRLETITTMSEGIQIHVASLTITLRPHLLNMARIPIGETTIGVNGKKYRP